jgi:NADPH:quinone reductase-like Zn-dependent oxidoreductase
MPTVLIIGATGNVGAAAIHGARRNNFDVLAVVSQTET